MVCVSYTRDIMFPNTGKSSSKHEKYASKRNRTREILQEENDHKNHLEQDQNTFLKKKKKNA